MRAPAGHGRADPLSMSLLQRGVRTTLSSANTFRHSANTLIDINQIVFQNSGGSTITDDNRSAYAAQNDKERHQAFMRLLPLLVRLRAKLANQGIGKRSGHSCTPGIASLFGIGGLSLLLSIGGCGQSIPENSKAPSIHAIRAPWPRAN
ncbi:hypothetical protein [Paraburkholderia sp. RAU2J]|uniref:hypothetical protein n=1 Tax=Paraburkholderia sp. RAU2J TaxID=1938810 RepID=UPI0011C3A257|nr:hypothetical protein [Paraburkholderia sp. RAU2J]